MNSSSTPISRPTATVTQAQPQTPTPSQQERARQEYAMQMMQGQRMVQNGGGGGGAQARGQASNGMHSQGRPVQGNVGNGTNGSAMRPSTPGNTAGQLRPTQQYYTPSSRPHPSGAQTLTQNNPSRPLQNAHARPRPIPSPLPLNSAQAQLAYRNPSLGNASTPGRPPHPLSNPPLSANLNTQNQNAGPGSGSNPNSAASSPVTPGFPQNSRPTTNPPGSVHTMPVAQPPPFRETNSSDPLVAYLKPHLERKTLEDKARTEALRQFSRNPSPAPASGPAAMVANTPGLTAAAGNATSAVGTNRYQGVYNGGGGLAGPLGKDGMKKERTSFLITAKGLLHAFGDVRNPSEDTANLVVDMVFGYLTELCSMPPLPPGRGPIATSTDPVSVKKGAQTDGKIDKNESAAAGRGKGQDKVTEKDKEKDKADEDAGDGNGTATGRTAASGPPLRNLTVSHLRHRLSSSPAHSLQLSRFQEAFHANKLHRDFMLQRKQTAAAFGNNPADTAQVGLDDTAMLEELALHLVDGDQNRLSEVYGGHKREEFKAEENEAKGDARNVKISLRERKRRAMGQFEESKKRRKALAAWVAPILAEAPDQRGDDVGSTGRNEDFGAFAMQLDMDDREGLGGFLGDELKGANFGNMGSMLRRFM